MSSTDATRDDEHLFAQAMAELESGQPQPGLWAKAFADADGDENKAKARYLTLRVKALSAQPVVAAAASPAAPATEGGNKSTSPDEADATDVGSEPTVPPESVVSNTEPAEQLATPTDSKPLSGLSLIRHVIVCLALFGLLTPWAGPASSFGSPFWFGDVASRLLIPVGLVGVVFLFGSLFFTSAIQANGKRIFVRTLWLCTAIPFLGLWFVNLNKAKLERMSSESVTQNAAKTYAPIIESSNPAVETSGPVEASVVSSLPPVSETGRFKPVSNGAEILDAKTNLIWRRCAEGMVWAGGICVGAYEKYSFEGAQQHAADEAYRIGKQWRVPSKEELEGLVDYTRQPAIDPVAFPAAPDFWFWSSSANPGLSGYAWYVDSDGRLVVTFNLRYRSNAVRLVRSGQ